MWPFAFKTLQTYFLSSAFESSEDGRQSADFVTPIYTSSEKRQLISYRMKGLLVAAFRSPPMKALERRVETLGL